MKRHNPRFGCVRIAEQISRAFGLDIDKDVVRRVLAQHYRPDDSVGNGPSRLTFVAQSKDSLWSVDLFRCESILLHSYWVMLVMDVFTRRIIGFGVERAEIDEIKSIPNVPVSHPFVERLIVTLRREYLDRTFFWNALGLERKLAEFSVYYNRIRVHQSLSGSTPEEQAGKPRPGLATLDSYGWREHCRGLFQTPIAA